ncbi:GAF domain-containing sensor histidine kinase [Janthinobacterium lividum]|uniref:histidine kinase n=1 Tax=Janthinobacterium lividum TaxID=29581 RepID=A0A1E8PQE2_9BURK|nr:hypothetical protein BA896_003125 [Janthinobacterium lividum]
MLDPASTIPEYVLDKWQHTVDVMAEVFEVPAGLIMRVRPGQIEVLVAAQRVGNPYHANEMAVLNTGLYCETVMETRALLYVPNALDDIDWKDNPDVALDMISYLGVPLLAPNQNVFGTICVLDNKTRSYHEKYVELMWEIKKSIERDLELMEQQQRLIEQQEQLKRSNIELTAAIARQHSDAEQLQRSNEKLNLALATLTAMQSELLKSAKNAALGALVAGVAHELGTPIGNSMLVASTIQDQASAFRDKMATGLTRTDLSSFCEAMHDGTFLLTRNLERASQLVASFKRISVDPTDMTPSHFKLRHTVETVAAAVPGLRLVNTVNEDLSMTGYLGAFADVLAELLENAARHAFVGRAPGNVTVAARMTDARCIELTVSDDGVGISAADQSRVFDPFFTTQLGQGGSGLGLYTTYNLVSTAMRGTIVLVSTPGVGSCFSVTIPDSAY